MRGSSSKTKCTLQQLAAMLIEREKQNDAYAIEHTSMIVEQQVGAV